MKHIFTLLPFLISGILGFSQTNRQLNAGSGQTHNSTSQLSWSLGDLVINSSNNSNIDYSRLNQHDFTTNNAEITEEIAIKVFPNPTVKDIHVRLDQEWVPSDLKLVGMSGKTHYSGIQHYQKEKISLDKLPSGYYFLIVSPRNGERAKSIKILKSK